MKISLPVSLSVLLMAAMSSDKAANAAGHDGSDGAHDPECTHGKLYIMDDSTSNVYVVDVHDGLSDNMIIGTALTLPSEGSGGLTVYGPPADPLLVQYRGVEPDFDGFVRVIDTGFSFDDHGDHGHIEYTDASVYSNAIIEDCPRPIHEVRNGGRIAIFCDGAFDAAPEQKNTTIFIVDESKLGTDASSTTSAIVHTTTLEGSHHGVAIPVDDGHLLHSIATPERILRDPNASSLPSTFHVTSFDGEILHAINDTSSQDDHCSGFHGSASIGNRFFLACDDIHGGILLVDYDPTTESYTSRAITYPDNDETFSGLRVGSFAYHYLAPAVIGMFSAREGTEYYLLSIAGDATSIGEQNILKLPGNTRQCGVMFEVGRGRRLLVLMPDGVLHVFEVNDDGSFMAVMNQSIVPGMTACSEAVFVAGIGQAFVATVGTKILYAVDLSHVDEGEMDVYSTTLPFTPTTLTVSGFSLEAACDGSHSHEHDADADNGEDAPSPSAAGRTALSAIFSAAVVASVIGTLM